MFTIYDWFGYELPIKERYQLIKEAEFEIPTMVVHLPSDNNPYNTLGLYSLHCQVIKIEEDLTIDEKVRKVESLILRT